MAIFIEEPPAVKRTLASALTLRRQPAYTLQGRLQQLRGHAQQQGKRNSQGLPDVKLSRGAYNDAVRCLQLVLVELGILDYSVIRYEAGSYNDATVAGVAALQKSLGLAPNGVYDKSVRSHLQRALDSPSGSPAAA